MPLTHTRSHVYFIHCSPQTKLNQKNANFTCLSLWARELHTLFQHIVFALCCRISLSLIHLSSLSFSNFSVLPVLSRSHTLRRHLHRRLDFITFSGRCLFVRFDAVVLLVVVVVVSFVFFSFSDYFLLLVLHLNQFTVDLQQKQTAPNCALLFVCACISTGSDYLSALVELFLLWYSLSLTWLITACVCSLCLEDVFEWGHFWVQIVTCTRILHHQANLKYFKCLNFRKNLIGIALWRQQI